MKVAVSSASGPLGKTTLHDPTEDHRVACNSRLPDSTPSLVERQFGGHDQPAKMASRALAVQIWSDIICRFCPIGELRFQIALASLAELDRVEVMYRSYRLQPSTTPIRVAEYLDRKFWPHQKAATLLRQISQLAAQEGLTYKLENTLCGDTLHAHRLLHLARMLGKQTALMNRFYVGYLSEHANPFDRDTLVHLAIETGLHELGVVDVLDSARFAAEVEADQNEAHVRDISGVPHFLIDDHISVSGARAPETFLATLNSAWASRSVFADGSLPAEISRGPGGCDVPISP